MYCLYISNSLEFPSFLHAGSLLKMILKKVELTSFHMKNWNMVAGWLGEMKQGVLLEYSGEIWSVSLTHHNIYIGIIFSLHVIDHNLIMFCWFPGCFR